jgi:hypothetical protein
MRVVIPLGNRLGPLGILIPPTLRSYPVAPAPFFDRHNSAKVGDVSDCRARADEINVRSRRQNKAHDDENDADASNDVSRSHGARLASTPAVVESQFRLGSIGSSFANSCRANHSIRSGSDNLRISEKSNSPKAWLTWMTLILIE